jgi:hypothetical protein
MGLIEGSDRRQGSLLSWGNFPLSTIGAALLLFGGCALILLVRRARSAGD